MRWSQFSVFGHVFSRLTSNPVSFLLLQEVDSDVNLYAGGITSFTVRHLELPNFLSNVAFKKCLKSY
jgi:hypothetical protein